MLTEILVIDY